MIRTIPIFALFISTSLFAADSISISYQMSMQADAKTKINGITNYYFQDGNIRAEIDIPNAPFGKTVFIEKNGKKFTLFPKEKTYMEVTEFTNQYSKRNKKIMKASPYKSTGQKKKIAGYDCEVFVKEDAFQKETACLSQSLLSKYASIVKDIKKVNEDMDVRQGVPLEMESIGKGKNTNKTKIKVLKINPSPQSVSFSIPKGYTKKKSFEGSGELDSMVKDLQKSLKNGKLDENKIKELQKMAEEMKKKYGQ